MAEEIIARDCEMTISRAEFLRLLPAAVAGATYEVTDSEITHGDSRRGWRIRLDPMADLAHGRIRLPRHRVAFAFNGFAAREVEAFFRRFDLYFARGGG